MALFEPHGPLVHANRGLIEYSDLLKRPLEAFKYLLGFSETARCRSSTSCCSSTRCSSPARTRSTWRPSRSCRTSPRSRAASSWCACPTCAAPVEQEIYDAQITPTTVGKHVAPHATEVAALWAVLTRLKKPIPDRYPGEVRELVDDLAPLEKLRLYEDGAAPDRLSPRAGQGAAKWRPDLYEESDAYPNYEGRSGASAREIKTALFNAAQNPDDRCLNPLAVLEELDALCQDKSVYDFLQQEVVDGYHDHEEFVRVVEASTWTGWTTRCASRWGWSPRASTASSWSATCSTSSHWVKGEKMRNRRHRRDGAPGRAAHGGDGGHRHAQGEDPGEFRRGLIGRSARTGWTTRTPRWTTPRIFPDLFRRLRDHYFEERKRAAQATRRTSSSTSPRSAAR